MNNNNENPRYACAHKFCRGTAGGCQYSLVNREPSLDALESILREAVVVGTASYHEGRRASHHPDFRIAIAACPNACTGPQTKDLGIIAVKIPTHVGPDCDGCSRCEMVCRENAIRVVNGRAHFVPERCVGCGQCICKCPTEAIGSEPVRFRVLVGGRMGRHPRWAEQLCVADGPEVVKVVQGFLDEFRRHAGPGERAANVAESIGVAVLRERKRLSMCCDNENMLAAPDAGRSREKEQHYAWLRPAVQIGFVVFSILLGLQFRSFVLSLAGPADSPIKPRPAAVEAYLPISSLMSLTYVARTGISNRVHPAGLLIFTLTLVLALLVRRGFCSWVCPIGTASEWMHKTGRALLGRNLSMPRWFDWIIRSLKYGLLGFFLYSILTMPVAALQQFIYGPYNRIADVKMYLFFSHISMTALCVILVLVLLSVLFKNFVCRYLCPYGALLGLFSSLSPCAIRRDTDKCTDCGRCGRACPNRIMVDKKKTVRSVECTACYDCIGACRVDGAPRMSWPRTKMSLSIVAYGVMTAAAFFFTAQTGRVFDYWQSQTPPGMYRALHNRASEISHPR